MHEPAQALFFSLTPERILDAVELGGRRATGRALALNSLENRVYDVELDDESRVVAKFYRPGRWSQGALLDEHAFLAELAEADVPVVPPLDLGGGTLGALDGEGRVGLDDGRAGVIRFALFPRARGRVPEELDDAQLAQLGRLVARLHLVGARRPAPSRPTLTPASYGTASVQFLVEKFFVPPELEARYVAAATRIVDGAARLFASLQPETIRLHGDCHLGNLLWGASGPFFLDFDDFLAGPPAQDLWLIAPGPDEEGARQRAIVADAYATIRDLDRRTLRLVEPLRGLRILRYAAWIATRWQDPAFQRTFPEFRESSWWQREVVAVEEQAARVDAA